MVPVLVLSRKSYIYAIGQGVNSFFPIFWQTTASYEFHDPSSMYITAISPVYS